MKAITATGIALRFIFALLLVLLTYNPTPYSYYHWFATSLSSITPYIAIAGLVLLIGWAIYIRATLRSLGFIGILLAGAFFGCFIWLLVYWGVLTLEKFSTLAWVTEVLLAALLTVGMSWSHIRRRLSGQVDTDDVDENI